MRPFHLHRTLAGLLLAAACAGAAGQVTPPLADYSLEQLSQIVVTSVARQETTLASAPVSIQRITRQQIRRAGATTLPEALRLATSLMVVRTTASSYAITARGFSSTLENKMLVMIDGRSVYSPLFSGVFWDVHDVLLEDVERIEVISGPGSTIWGANAVNGVINVITRSARDTRGSYAALAAGNTERMGAARYGAGLPGGGSYRIYAKYHEHDDLENEAGQAVRGRWHRTQAGFRADFAAGQYAATVSGDAYSGRSGSAPGPDLSTSGSNLVARLQRSFADGSGLRLQAWLDHVERTDPDSASEKLDTLDLEAQHDFKLAGRHTVSWGGGYRHARDRVQNGGTLEFAPADATLRWANVFAQDQILVAPDVQLTLGTRFEKTTYTGVEWLPMARLAYHAGGNDLLWVAATRTVRAPSRLDRDLNVLNPAGNPQRYMIETNRQFKSELARVLEIGYRGEAGPQFAYTLVGYYAKYDDLRTLEPRPGMGDVFANMGEGRTRGLEARARWQVMPRWVLTGGAVAQRLAFWRKPGSLASPRTAVLSANDPQSFWRLHSAHDLGAGMELDFELRRVARLPQPAVPSYHELDVRLAWNAAPGLEASITGRNLLHSAHPEFGPAATRQLVGRSVLFNLSWRH